MNKVIIIAIMALMSFAVQAQESIKVEKQKASHRTIYTDIIIDATPEQVWSVLTDFGSYENWSAYFFGIKKGDFKNGGNVTVETQPNAKKDKRRKYNHIIEVENGKYFRWHGDAFAMGMKDDHIFKVEATTDGKTRFIHSDASIGGMTWLMGNAVMKANATNMPLFNQALKKEVEKRFN